MAPNKQKVVATKNSRRKPAMKKGLQNLPSETPATGTAPTKLTLKLNMKSGAQRDALLPVSAYQFPLSAPPSDNAPENGGAEDVMLQILEEQGVKRGGRQKKKVHAPDMVFGSEMDDLMSSSKIEGDDDVQMASSPPKFPSRPTPEQHNPHTIDFSSDTVQAPGSPPARYSRHVDQDVYDILNSLRGSSEIQVDLPTMSNSAEGGTQKPYTASFLTQLYIQCYENRLWHICDLIADTWIRALQQANTRSRKSKDPSNHMWRKNSALLKKFKNGLLGFKVDVEDYDLEVLDPELESNVTTFNAERLRELYDHTAPKCGARLLWADALALCGKKMESVIAKGQKGWPQELFFDVMCTSLRMVGRKLTLKIEERYEGAWCRYHEHVKHGQPCYRHLAWTQKGGREEDAAEEDEEIDMNISMTEGGKRGFGPTSGDEQGEAKRVRFDDGDVIDFGDTDAEGESEEG